jgi:prepilin-type N-terminal cleavage/methylation domain-containing protein
MRRQDHSPLRGCRAHRNAAGNGGHSPPYARRGGFTLIEVLVVMVIISILVAVTATVVGSAIGNARIAATKGTITKISGLVQERVRAIDQATRTDAFDNSVRLKIQQQGYSRNLAQIVVMKEALKNAFGYPPPPNADVLENPRRLYQALTQRAVFGLPPVDTDTFSSNEVKFDSTDVRNNATGAATPDGEPDDPRPYFVDAWGEPLRFYLWPTRLVRPGGPGTPVRRDIVDLLMSDLSPDMLVTDAHDPFNEFTVWAGQTPERLQQVEATFHSPSTYHVPLIVSAGGDRQLGLHEPFFVDYDLNGDGGVDTTPPQRNEDGNGNGQHDNLLGPLGQPLAAVLSNPAESALNDNITNQQRAGGN